MSCTNPDTDIIVKETEPVDVNNTVKENELNSEKTSDSGVDVTDVCSSAFLPSSDSELSPLKSISTDFISEIQTADESKYVDGKTEIESDSLSSPVSVTSDYSPVEEFFGSHNDIKDNNPNIDEKMRRTEILTEKSDHVTNLTFNSDFAASTASLNHEETKHCIEKPYSRSVENISLTGPNISTSNSEEKDIDQNQVLSQFMSQKNKASATQKIPENGPFTIEKSATNGPITIDKSGQNPGLDNRYPRIPKEILSQDIGSIVKNVHGIFSSVSGSLKHAYTQRTTVQNKQPIKTKVIPNTKVMNEIFEDDNTEADQSEAPKINTDNNINQTSNEHKLSNLNVEQNFKKEEQKEMVDDWPQAETDPKSDVLKLQIESLERVVFEQRKENASLRERVKQQVDEMQEKDQTFKELEMKLDLMSKRVEQAEREKDAAVMRYASVECSSIEARRAADNAARAEKAAQNEVELLNNKLKSAHAEKQRIIQLYDDKCHDLANSEREVSKVREDLKELEGRLKWTQSKLRMEMDAYKESSERAEKLQQQVAELEANKEIAAANNADTLRAKQFEAELKECRAALILCRHDNSELERRVTSLTQQLDSCRRERDTATGCLTRATAEIEELKVNNLKLEEEAAELAALRAKAALADTLSVQLQRESIRAIEAESALSSELARSETCVQREAAALRHVAELTAAHVVSSADADRHRAKAQALSAENENLRERVTSLEEECSRIQVCLGEETERRNKENRVLARKVAELTEELSEANKKLDWERGENGVLKKKHASAIKELNRELQRSLKRCEQLEAKLPPPDAASTRTGSVTSLSSSESCPQEERLHNGHSDTIPDLQIKCPSFLGSLFTKVRSPDKQALIERIVSLQRAAARRAERCEFLEEHSRQLTAELANKSRLLRHMLSERPAGAVASHTRDLNKKEIARLGGGAMAAVYGGDPNGMTLELSLEMNRRLQAVLEDTLLNNITLKENMDTLGAEISRLKEQKNTTTDAK